MASSSRGPPVQNKLVLKSNQIIEVSMDVVQNVMSGDSTRTIHLMLTVSGDGVKISLTKALRLSSWCQ